MNQIKLLDKIKEEEGIDNAMDKLKHMVANIHVARIRVSDEDGLELKRKLTELIDWRVANRR